MTGRRDWFIKIDDIFHGKVRFVDDNRLNSGRVGCVVLRDSNDREVDIDGVLYVLGLKINLLSLSRLLQKGFIMEMKLTVHAKQSENRTFQVAMGTRKH